MQIQNGSSRSKRLAATRWLAAGAMIATIASSSANATTSSSSSVEVNGMVAHLPQNLSAGLAIGTSVVSSNPTVQTNNAVAQDQDAAQALMTFFSTHGAPHPSYVSEAVSLAGTAEGVQATTTTTAATVLPNSSAQNVDGNSVVVVAASTDPNRAVFPTVTPPSSSTGSTTVAPSSTVAPTLSNQDPSSWHYFGGALGCEEGTVSGTAYICHATGTSNPTMMKKKRAISRDEEDQKRDEKIDELFEAAWTKEKRQSTSGSDEGSSDPSGNGGPPADVLNKDSPDIGWLDLIVGAVPYKNGDLAPSIVWILATLVLVPLFLVRLLRRSSLIAHVLITVFLWGVMMIAAFAIRAQMANNGPRTNLMEAENFLLQALPFLLIEPLLNLLALYAQQGGFPTGVPRVALVLRILNFIALILYIVGAVYITMWLNGWDNALQINNQIADRSSFPTSDPPSISRIGPIVAAFLQVVCILGALLLIPIARGENGSLRPGGFIAILVILVTIPVVYRVLQTLHAQAELSDEDGGSANPFTVLATKGGATLSSAAMNAVMNLVPVSSVAPPGMYNSNASGIDWSQLQQTLASRGRIQSPLVFNLVYIFPQWLMVFLFFFVHAPGHENQGKLAPASNQP